MLNSQLVKILTTIEAGEIVQTHIDFSYVWHQFDESIVVLCLKAKRNKNEGEQATFGRRFYNVQICTKDVFLMMLEFQFDRCVLLLKKTFPTRTKDVFFMVFNENLTK